MNLRRYQLSCVDKTFKLWEDYQSVVGRLFTGGGKTIIFSDIIRRFGKRALVIAHREELIWQARNKIEAVTGFKFQVEMGDYRINTNFEPDLFNPNNVGEAGVVATVQTLSSGGDGCGRISKFLPTDFDLLIIDECHHATAPIYRKVMDYFKKNPNLKILGVTATPSRSDEESLGQIFEEVAFDHDMQYGMREGWLAPVDAQSVYIESLDTKSININCGDLNQGQLSSVMMAEKPLHGIADSILTIAGERRGIGFSPSVEHAKMMTDIFNRHRSGWAAHINGKTDKDERKKINADFARGAIKWIWNCGTHTEGFDDAGVEIIVPKPTKSVSLLEQMVGRGTRPCDSIAHKLGDEHIPFLRRNMIAKSEKPACLVLEYYGNRYDLATTFDLFAGNVSDEVVKAAKEIARKSGGRTRVTKTIEEEEKRAEEKKKKELEEAARKAKLIIKSKFQTKQFDPFSILGITAAKPRGWDVKKQLSPKMENVLRKAGFNPEQMGYAEAKQLVGVLVDRWMNHKCSIKQAATLKKYGYDVNSSFEDAKKIITAIQENGWKRPAGDVPTAKKRSIPKRKVSVDETIDTENPF